MTETYAALHCHSQHSLLDGMSTTKSLARRARELGIPAVGLTDHGSMGGAYAFYHDCVAEGVKPIIGLEAYVAPGSRFDKKATKWGPLGEKGREAISGNGAYFHMTLFARNATGVRNLYKLSERAYTEGFYYKPRIDLELLREHSEGIIGTTGCMSGAIPTLLRLGRLDAAYAYLSTLGEILSPHANSRGNSLSPSLYIEVMDHGLELPGEISERELNSRLISLSTKFGVPLLQTLDSHFTCEDDSETHQALLCVGTRSTLQSPTFSFNGSGYYLQTYEEARRSFPDNVEALENTLRLADSVEDYSEVFSNHDLMPKPKDSYKLLDSVVIDASYSREIWRSPQYVERWDHELEIIERMGFEDYFLVVADIVNWARREGIWVGPGRGSGGGSLVAQMVGITDLNPVKHGLLFERFLNPQRASAPDFDVDFDPSRIDEVIQYAQNKYGVDHVARIGTTGTLTAKAAVQRAANVYGISDFKDRMALSDLVPKNIRGRPPELKDCKDLKKANPAIWKLACEIEGAIFNRGTHAAGLIISPVPITDYCPVRKGPDDDMVTTEYGKEILESLGFVKLDFLKLETLAILRTTLELMGSPYELNDIPFDDAKTFKLLSSGQTLGVFQLDSAFAIGITKKIKPSSLDELAALMALLRPGSTDNGVPKEYAERYQSGQRKPTIHPELNDLLAPILAPTYGLIVFQEQVMKCIAAVTGWGYGEADLIFNAMRKKDLAKMEQSKPAFFSAATGRGLSSGSMDALWEVLVPFSDYSFGEAHSMGYAYISYWTAYLKANHPAEYMAALLTSAKSEDTPKYLTEAMAIGVAILPPDVNESELGFTLTKKGIRYGLGSIKGIGEPTVKALVAERPYRSLHHFFERSRDAVLNSGSLKALIRSGSLDSLWSSREELLEQAEGIAQLVRDHRGTVRQGQRGFFPRRYVPRKGEAGTPEKDSERRAAGELETLGAVLTHPKLILRLTRPLDGGEWAWVKGLLAEEKALQEASFVLPGGAKLAAKKTTDTGRLRHSLGLVGIVVREE